MVVGGDDSNTYFILVQTCVVFIPALCFVQLVLCFLWYVRLFIRSHLSISEGEKIGKPEHSPVLDYLVFLFSLLVSTLRYRCKFMPIHSISLHH